MSISFIGASSIAGTSLTLPTHAANDRLVMFVARTDSQTSPTPPTDWILCGATSTTNIIVQFWTKLAQSSVEVSGTWTNATFLACASYRSPYFLMVGSSGATGAAVGSGGTTTWAVASPASPVTNDRWLLLGGGHRSNDCDLETPPSGYTNRATVAGGSVGELCLHDSNANTTSTASPSRTLTAGTSAAFRSLSLELLETTYTINGGSSRPVNPFFQQVIG